MSSNTETVARRMPYWCRRLLVDHVESGERPVNAWEIDVAAARRALIADGYLQPLGDRRSPRATRITELGREVVGHVLGDYAEALIRAGALERESVRDVEVPTLRTRRGRTMVTV